MAQSIPLNASEHASLDELITLVQANRGEAVAADVVDRAKAALIALRDRHGIAAWRLAIADALTAAKDEDEPLRGRVATFVAGAAERHAQRTAARPIASVAPTPPARREPFPDPKKTAQARERVRNHLLTILPSGEDGEERADK